MTNATTVVPRQPPPATAAGGKSIRAGIPMIVGSLIGAAIGFLGVRYGMDLLLRAPGPKLLSVAAFAILPVVWLLVVGFHELGHIAGGWMVGGRFLLWSAGPFMVRRTPVGIRMTWNRHVNLAGGLGACLPLDPAQMTPRRAAVMIVSGPTASLLLTAVMLWIGAWLAAGTAPVTVAVALTQNFALLVAGMSLLIFIVTAAPSASGGFKSDGKRVFDLLRGGPASEQEAAMLVLTTAGLSGVRPADYDPALLAKAVSLGDGSMFDRYGHLTAYYHAADRCDWAAAQGHLDYVLVGADQLAPFLRDVLRCEYAWLMAGQTSDAAAARAWLETAGKLEFDPATRLRAEAAVLLAEGKSADASAKAREGLVALQHRSLSPVQNPFFTDALEAILRRAGA